MKYIAYMTKGLEKVAQAELLSQPGVTFIEEGDKRIVFETDEDVNLLLSLRTIDDIGIFLGKIEKVSKVSQITDYIKKIDLADIKLELEKFRKLTNTFSMTVSSARSSINTKELMPEMVNLIKENYQWKFVELEHSNFDLKVFIDRTDVFLSIRLTEKSLHNRVYKTLSKPGSLKPTVAAAMVKLATGDTEGNIIVDNFCGSGTILCESLLARNIIYGGDIDSESVTIAKKNIEMLSAASTENIVVLDAINSGWQNNFFDVAISNLPWDKQIKVESITDLYEGTLHEYARILKSGGVLCALVGKPELFIKYAKKYFPEKKIEQITIGLLGQSPTIVLMK